MLNALTYVDHVESRVFAPAMDQEVVFAKISVDKTAEMVELPQLNQKLAV
jgi:hypothetical protein